MADAKDIPKMQSPEATPDERNRHMRGIYRHGESGRQLVAHSVPQADALSLQGWTRVGDLPKPGTKVPTKTEPDEPKQPAEAQVTDLQAQLKAAEKARKDAEKQAEAEKKAREEAEKALADAKNGGNN